jgi:hypothetical protein
VLNWKKPLLTFGCGDTVGCAALVSFLQLTVLVKLLLNQGGGMVGDSKKGLIAQLKAKSKLRIWKNKMSNDEMMNREGNSWCGQPANGPNPLTCIEPVPVVSILDVVPSEPKGEKKKCVPFDAQTTAAMNHEGDSVTGAAIGDSALKQRIVCDQAQAQWDIYEFMCWISAQQSPAMNH